MISASHWIVCIAAIAGFPALMVSETHRFTPAAFYSTYSFAHPPALRIKPGDHVMTKTLDAGGSDENGKEVILSTTPGPWGGNMDYNGLNSGVKLMLQVNEPGALLFMGDGHARQGDGEVVGTGMETSLDVEFTVDLVKKKAIAWPRLENNDYIMVLASARPLLEAFEHATTEMQKLLVADYGFNERGA